MVWVDFGRRPRRNEVRVVVGVEIAWWVVAVVVWRFEMGRLIVLVLEVGVEERRRWMWAVLMGERGSEGRERRRKTQTWSY